MKKITAVLFCSVMLFANLNAQNKDIIDVASGSKDHSTLVAAIKAAGLVQTLKGKGPFTVFAPTNSAFNNLPKGTLEMLLKPENKAKLAAILTYHVVSGNITASDLIALIKKGNGTAVVKTVNGAELKASLKDGKVIIEDAKGGKATVTATDLKASNGVIHVTNAVSMPE